MQIAIDNTNFSTTGVVRDSGRRLWTWRLTAALPVSFLMVDGIMKLFKPEIVVQKTVELGYHESVIIPLGVVLIVTTLLYVFSRTAVLGAVLLTGYLGGAVATHVRVGDSGFSMIFPMVIGSLLWLGLYLRDGRLRSLMPLRTPSEL